MIWIAPVGNLLLPPPFALLFFRDLPLGRIPVTTAEFLNATSRIYELAFPGVEGVVLGVDFRLESIHAQSRASLHYAAIRQRDGQLVIIRVQSFLHRSSRCIFNLVIAKKDKKYPTTTQLLHFHCLDRKAINPVVQIIVRVTSYFDPSYVMHAGQPEKILPEILILNGLLRGCSPAFSDPVVDPSVIERPLHVRAVGMHDHPARKFQHSQRLDHSRELHPVVGSLFGSTGDHPFSTVGGQNSRPATRTRVTTARAVGINNDLVLNVFFLRQVTSPRFQ